MISYSYFFNLVLYHIIHIRQEKIRQTDGSACRFAGSLLAEGHAVGALIHGRIALMGTHQDSVQRTEILLAAVVCALGDGAFNALVCVTAHVFLLLLSVMGLVCPESGLKFN